MNDPQTLQAIRQRYQAVARIVDERGRRAVAGAEALALGHGGISAVARATGLARQTVSRGAQEVRQAAAPPAADERSGAPASEPRLPPGHVRRPGGGRKSLQTLDPTLRTELERLVEPTARGDAESPLRWTCKSLRRLARELAARGHQVSHETVAHLLRALGYSLQANRKTREGAHHPDRDAQFAHITATSQAYLTAGDPVISVDTKKKELIGDAQERRA